MWAPQTSIAYDNTSNAVGVFNPLSPSETFEHESPHRGKQAVQGDSPDEWMKSFMALVDAEDASSTDEGNSRAPDMDSHASTPRSQSLPDEAEMVDLDPEEGRRRGEHLMSMLQLQSSGVDEKEVPKTRLASSFTPLAASARAFTPSNVPTRTPLRAPRQMISGFDASAPVFTPADAACYQSMPCMDTSDSPATAMCWDLIRNGQCHRGKACRWAHF